MRLFGIQRELLTAYHLQADGHTERVNLDIQAYLQALVNEKQDDWPAHLKMVIMYSIMQCIQQLK